MGSVRVTLCTGVLGVAALTLTACAAYAEETTGISVTPSAPAPGTDVALRVAGCGTETTATAVSAAFVADARLTGADGTLVGESRVRSTLTAGTYSVKVTCGSVDRNGTITVGKRAAGSLMPLAPASPVAPVDAGGGGAAHLAAEDARAAAPGTAHAVTGLALAGVAAVVVALRGLRRSRRTG
jgi:hypothetical protein